MQSTFLRGPVVTVEVINLAIVATFTVTVGGFNTPRTCLLISASAVLYNRQTKIGDREVKGWRAWTP